MERIAKALNVSTYTVSKDLKVFSSPKNPSRPKGGGTCIGIGGE
jgi:hypothetical protein